jgi:hypothetical protein
MNQIIFGCPRPALRESEEAQTVRPGPDKVRLPPSFGWISFCRQLAEVRESLSRGMDPLRGIVSTRSRVAECPRAFPGRPGLLPPATPFPKDTCVRVPMVRGRDLFPPCDTRRGAMWERAGRSIQAERRDSKSPMKAVCWRPLRRSAGCGRPAGRLRSESHKSNPWRTPSLHS